MDRARKRRITEAERSRIIGLVKQSPPGRLTVQADGELAAADESGPPECTLDALAAEAGRLGIEIGRSQVRRIRWPRECVGAAPGPGHARRTRTSREKDEDHRALHLPARRCDGRLHRRARTGDPTHVPAGAGLVAGRSPHQVRGRLRPRTGEDLGLRRPSNSRRAGGHHDRILPQQCLLPAVSSEDRGGHPAGDIYVVTDNLSSHNSLSTRTWLEDHPRIRHSSSPSAPAGSTSRKAGGASSARPPSQDRQSFAGPPEIEQATRLTTSQLNARTQPWI